MVHLTKSLQVHLVDCYTLLTYEVADSISSRSNDVPFSFKSHINIISKRIIPELIPH